MQQSAWQFWIDVGGTFTDCFARRPDGSLVRHKLLSSGVTKGSAQTGSTPSKILDPLRAGDPARFWNGYRLRLLGPGGDVVAESRVKSSAADGTLYLDDALALPPAPGQAYELASGEEAPIVAIRYLLGLSLADEIPHVVVRLGTTRGTNALITRRGARTAFVTTRGLRDILEIGYQNRPKLFELAIEKRVPLFTEVVEIDERVTAEGEVLRAPDADTVRRQLQTLRSKNIESLAICLLHAYRFGDHEELVARLAQEMGFQEISVSSRVAPLVKIVARGDTTVMDAYLNPILRDYITRLRRSLPAVDLRIMTSAGGLVAAEHFVGKDSILSGPAGGVVGFSRVAQAAGFTQAIGFDMGGTSTDVSRFDGRFELEYETEKAGVRVVAPMMAIETVAAGGGSICAFDGTKLVVGPQSAGAAPGPACYGQGGPLAVTDVNFYLGKIPPEHFPFPLDRAAVERRLAKLVGEIERATARRYSPVELCDGFLQVANANMVKAIQSISVAKGCDPRDYVLVGFGGAAGQHACAVAAELDMSQVLLHPDAGILSAYGIGAADVVRHAARGVYQAYSAELVDSLAAVFTELSGQARRQVLAEGIAPDRIEIRRALDLRYRGLDAWLTVPEPADGNYAEAYAAAHEKLYGYRNERREIEVVAVRVEVVGHTVEPEPVSAHAAARSATPERMIQVHFAARSESTALYDRAKLQPGDVIVGPAVIHEATATTVIDPGWRGEVLSRGELLLSHQPAANADVDLQPAGANSEVPCDPATLEVFNNRFAAIAEQMGITLRNTSSSVNVKERLDFSCAIFTSVGDLVVNAPHIPVHLGAMGETVRCILADNPDLRPGDVYVTNDPYRGGSHLPDVTVVTPIFDAAGRRLLFFTASRAHHAEIGGIVPGSMPPFSCNLAEEGVLISNFQLIAAGRSRFDEFARLLSTAKYPTRKLTDNLADVAAQVAANQQGARDLRRLVERHSLAVVQAYMGHIQNAAEQKMRQALRKLPDGRHRFEDHLDDGSPIAVAIDIDGDRATIDFTGTGPVLAGNLNANRAIVTAAVMYVLRTLIAEDIPLNQGVLAPVRIVLPECLLNPRAGATPEQSPAVVGGNVETSQRVVDVLLGALGLAAASQGTMNNTLFGDSTFGYYETICGGAGATADRDGADAVHTHMTNTRLTDPEVLEQRYPVRLREFSIRRGSGGTGKRRGGDGVVRQIEFLRPLDVSLLAERRGHYAPYGMAGGAVGAIGHNTLVHADGTREDVGGHAQFRAAAGDVLEIETPGGGGWGADLK
ncbi:MAG TPA: hydantoinase B/oxoprolinase family protein [Pirellulales bacterium]|nr:hydantoinase B/oxoprolinase family protein [Pirellulales bacterium]